MSIVLKTNDMTDVRFAEELELMVIRKLKAIYSRIKLDARCDVRQIRNTNAWWLRMLKIFLGDYGAEYVKALVTRFHMVKETNFHDCVTLESIGEKLRVFNEDYHNKKDTAYLFSDTESDCIYRIID